MLDDVLVSYLDLYYGILCSLTARADARVVSGICASCASTAVQALRSDTIVLHDLALGTGVSFGTFTCVTAGAGVEARATISAWFVIGTIVEILIAEKTTPSFVAHAIPRLDASAVNTSRISLALIAERSFPSGLTSINK